MHNFFWPSSLNVRCFHLSIVPLVDDEIDTLVVEGSKNVTLRQLKVVTIVTLAMNSLTFI